MQFDWKNMEASKRKRIVALGLVLALLIVLGACWQMFRPRDLERIVRKNTLVAVVDNSSFGAFNTEIAQAFADSLGVTLKVKRINGRNKQMRALQKNDCHLVAQLIPVTTCYENVRYTTPLCLSRLVLAQRAETAATTHKQLAHRLITTADNAPYEMRLRHLSAELADTIRTHNLPNLNDELLVQMVAQDKIDYTICVELQANKWAKQYENIDFSLPIGFTQQYAWAVNAESEHLAATLNDFLEKFMQTPTYRKIYNLYFN